MSDHPIFDGMVAEGRRRFVEAGRRYFGGAHRLAEAHTAIEAEVERMVPPRGGQPEPMPVEDPRPWDRKARGTPAWREVYGPRE